MIPLDLWEHQNAVKAVYSKCVAGVCQRYGITRAELDILLFLANSPYFDTATEIVEVRCFAKSQVSASVKALERQGFLRREYVGGNRKTAHLRLCEAAAGAIHDGQDAQKQFMACLLKGLSPAEIEAFKGFHSRIIFNIKRCLKEGEPC